jgi:aminotransferase
MEDVISLSVGEPDFLTPTLIRQRAIQEITKGHTKYTSNSGILELRQSISRYLSKKINVNYSANNEIFVTVGGSEAVDSALRALIDKGDEVLIPEPSFVCYAPLANLIGGVGTAVPIITTVENEFKLTPESLKNAITPKTKILILSYPNNPTGAVMRKDDLEKIAEILRKTNIMVISDEIYSELTYSKTPHISIASLPDLKERTLVINGFSKAFAMTGWRMGYLAGPAEIIAQILKIHQYAIMCAPTISQYAGITALEECGEDVKNMVEEYDLRRRFCIKNFNEMGLPCFTPEGAFYVFPCIKSTGLSSENFCKMLIEQKKVAVVPGSAFGASGEGYVRVSYAYSLKHLSMAMQLIREFLSELKKN